MKEVMEKDQLEYAVFESFIKDCPPYIRRRPLGRNLISKGFVGLEIGLILMVLLVSPVICMLVLLGNGISVSGVNSSVQQTGILFAVCWIEIHLGLLVFWKCFLRGRTLRSTLIALPNSSLLARYRMLAPAFLILLTCGYLYVLIFESAYRFVGTLVVFYGLWLMLRRRKKPIPLLDAESLPLLSEQHDSGKTKNKEVES